MSRVVRLGSALITALTLAACTDAPTTGGGEEAIGGGGCPEWGCTGNSPVIGPYQLHELDLDGNPNEQGVRIEGIRLGGVPVKVVFKDGDRIVALDGNGNGYEGAQLNGLTFFLGSPSERFRMQITQVTPKPVSPTKFWIGRPERIETYELKFAYETAPQDYRPVCKNPPPAESSQTGEVWTKNFEAMLFTGDRYDGRKKVVTAASYDEARRWFNVGCAGSVLAKLHLNRHTTASSDDDHRTHLEERQALLKMYTGDFCGEGYAFTEAGTPLHWENLFGWRKLDGNEVGFEAWWDARGARCLTEHRLGQAYYDQVIDACHLAPCDGNPFPDKWMEGAYLKTAIPF